MKKFRGEKTHVEVVNGLEVDHGSVDVGYQEGIFRLTQGSRFIEVHIVREELSNVGVPAADAS